jgi:hypothetical protein
MQTYHRHSIRLVFNCHHIEAHWTFSHVAFVQKNAGRSLLPDACFSAVTLNSGSAA